MKKEEKRRETKSGKQCIFLPYSNLDSEKQFSAWLEISAKNCSEISVFPGKKHKTCEKLLRVIFLLCE